MPKKTVYFASWGKSTILPSLFGSRQNSSSIYFASWGKLHDFIYWQIRTGSDWWFSKILRRVLDRIQFYRIRIGLRRKNLSVRSSLPYTTELNHLENHTVWDKNIFFQCNLSYPIHSESTEANHLGFTKPSSCLLLWCNYLIEAASLRHNRNSSGNNSGTFMHPND